MRARSAVLVALAAVLTALLAVGPAAHASDVSLAQQQSEEQTGGGTEEEGGATDTDEGSGRADAEVGADEGQTEDTGAETGPPWTYQMSRLILALLVLMALGIGLLYWRLVVQRQRRGI